MIKSNNILLLGSSGQLGSKLKPILKKIGNVICPSNIDFFSSFPNKLDLELDNYNPQIIVNTIAFTAVDLAENNRSEAFFVNCTLPKLLSKWCKKNSCLLLHYSSDYVFQGEGIITQ